MPPKQIALGAFTGVTVIFSGIYYEIDSSTPDNTQIAT